MLSKKLGITAARLVWQQPIAEWRKLAVLDVSAVTCTARVDCRATARARVFSTILHAESRRSARCLMEMLAPESQMMGLVLALGPRDSRMRAGAWRAIGSGVD